MPKVTIKMPDDLMSRLGKLGDRIDDVADKMLEVGAPIAANAIKTELEGTIGVRIKGKSRSTGELARNLEHTPPRLTKSGRAVYIKFKGKYPDGTPREKVANILEHGRSNMRARPFAKKAIRGSKEAVGAAMAEVFERETKG